jgi:hypothetical protein
MERQAPAGDRQRRAIMAVESPAFAALTTAFMIFAVLL